MTMLEIMKERLPKEAEIVKVKETTDKYALVVDVEGQTTKGSLAKTCAPDMAEYVVDYTISSIMLCAYCEREDFEKAKFWLEKQREMARYA